MDISKNNYEFNEHECLGDSESFWKQVEELSLIPLQLDPEQMKKPWNLCYWIEEIVESKWRRKRWEQAEKTNEDPIKTIRDIRIKILATRSQLKKVLSEKDYKMYVDKYRFNGLNLQEQKLRDWVEIKKQKLSKEQLESWKMKRMDAYLQTLNHNSWIYLQELELACRYFSYDMGF